MFTETIIPPPLMYAIDNNKNGKFFNGLLPQDIEDKIFKMASTPSVPYTSAPISYKRIFNNVLEELKNTFTDEELQNDLLKRIQKKLGRINERFNEKASNQKWNQRIGLNRYNIGISIHYGLYNFIKAVKINNDTYYSNTEPKTPWDMPHIIYYQVLTKDNLKDMVNNNIDCIRRKCNEKNCGKKDNFFAYAYTNVTKKNLEVMYENNGLKFNKNYTIKKLIQGLLKV